MALSTAFNDDLMHDPFSLSAPPDAPDAFGFEQIEFDLEQSDATGSGFIWSEGAFNLVLPPE